MIDFAEREIPWIYNASHIVLFIFGIRPVYILFQV